MRDLRRQYTLNGLAEDQLLDDAMAQLKLWFGEAVRSVPVDWLEPNAATLATSSSDGQVTARVILLKGMDQGGLLFFTNYDSPKGRQLAENPRAAVVIYWPHLERQVRIEGQVQRLSRADSIDYFHSRPRGSQIGAVVSSQSTVIPDRAGMDQRAVELEQELAGSEVPMPENWGGYRLEPTSLEFWQGRENRLHDRIRYRRQDDQWVRERLAP